MSFHERSTCRLCEGPLERVIDFGETPLANALETPAYDMFSADGQKFPHFSEGHPPYPLYLSRCLTCGHVQLPVVVDPTILFSHYRYVSSTSPSFRAHLHELARAVKSRSLSSRVPLVEIGSNDGTFLRACAAEEMPAIGVDPALNLASRASAEGMLTVPTFFGSAQSDAMHRILGRDANVVACNVLAHTDHVSDIVAGIAEILGRSGQLVFENAYLLDLLNRNEFGSCYHEHLGHFHLAPLRSFFARHKLRLYDVGRVSAQGGSIRGWVCHAARRDDATRDSERLLRLLDEESAIPALLDGWWGRIGEERTETLSELEPYRGKGLAVYGAPARLVTYAHVLGLTHADVSCVFDDNTLKQGMYTPGTHWSIVSPDELEKRNPPAVLIASWNYEREIRERHAGYTGKWILPRRT